MSQPQFRRGAAEALAAMLTEKELDDLLTKKAQEAIDSYVPPVNRQKPQGMFITPNLVMASQGVVARALVYTQMHFLSKRKAHELTASYKQLAGETGLTYMSVRRAIEWMVEEGWVMASTNQSYGGGHGSKTYLITEKAIQWLAPEAQKKHRCTRCDSILEGGVPQDRGSDPMSHRTGGYVPQDTQGVPQDRGGVLQDIETVPQDTQVGTKEGKLKNEGKEGKTPLLASLTEKSEERAVSLLRLRARGEWTGT